MLRLVRRGCALVVLAAPVALLPVQHGYAEVYKSVDAQGRVIFTDKQPKDTPSEVIHVQTTNSVAAPSASADSSGSDKSANIVVKYTRFAITTPADDQTLDYDVSSVDVVVEIEPALQEGHKIQFLLDGSPYGQPGTSTSTRFGNLQRGTHTAQARLLGKHGGALRSTPAIRFTIQQHADQQMYQNDDYYDYPYGARGPRGARSAGGAGEPSGASGDIGADSAPGAASPDRPYVPVRPLPKRRAR